MTKSIKLILYGKANCCLCQNLAEKLQQVSTWQIELEVRDISNNSDWWASYEYEVPVLCWWNDNQNPPQEIVLPRLSPRSPVTKLEELLQKFCENPSSLKYLASE